MDNKVLLCAIAKQENLYIREWVEYHLKLGFDHITIYDNNEPDGERISDVVGGYPNVNIIDFRGRHQKSCETQVAAYNACYKGAGAYDWVMFMDIDEFLWFRDYDNIKSFLEQNWIRKANVIRFHWKCYSDNGKLTYEDLPVMERFTEECKEKSVNYHMKQLYRTKLGTLRIVNVHYTNHVNNIYYPDGKPAPYITTTKDRNVHDELAHVKHYVTKSLEEYVKIKYARRGVGSSKTRLNLDFYFKYNEKTDEKLKYYKTLINDLQNNTSVEIKHKAMPYIPEERLPEPKAFESQSYNDNKFCPGAPKKQEIGKKENSGQDKKENLNVKKNVIESKQAEDGISICITAYDAQDFMEECLDSVASQTWFESHDNWEIIIGIDGCEKTLAKMKEIMHKYRNLRVLMMDSNKGTYVTSNTIMKEARYKWLIRFDSDDVMYPDMVGNLMKYAMEVKFDVLSPYAVNFGKLSNVIYDRHGCVLIKKDIFEKFGGYRPWKCAADTDFIIRVENYVVCKKYTNVCFKHRVHDNNLTVKKETCMNSDIRKEYKKQTKKPKTKNEAIIECTVSTFKVIELDVKKADNQEASIQENISLNVALCTIGKNENLYAREWVQWYMNLGISKIFLYDNNDTNGEHFEDEISDYIESGFVELINARGKSRYQLNAIMDCYNTRKNEYDWFCFFDMDEFLVLHQDNNINQYLSRSIFADFKSIAINWLNFDDNGLVGNENNYDRSVMDRFTHPAVNNSSNKYNNDVYKKIIRGGLDSINKIDSPHTFSPQLDKDVCNNKGVEIKGRHFKCDADYTFAQLNHYCTKTILEFILKSRRGGGVNGITEQYSNMDNFFKYNEKTDEKLSIVEKYSKMNDDLVFCVVNYNTPIFIDYLIKSIDSHVRKPYTIYVFDNSDKYPCVHYDRDNVIVLDNTKGDIINFDSWLENYPDRFNCWAKNNGWGSAKHCYTIQKCMDMIGKNFILLDSDVLIKKDPSDMVDLNAFYSGEVITMKTQKLNRIAPFICYINVTLCKLYGINYFYDEYMHGLKKEAHDYDTGGAFYKFVKPYPHREIKLSDYIIHYGQGSWSEVAGNTKYIDKHTQTPIEWINEHEDLWYMEPEPETEMKVEQEPEQETNKKMNFLRQVLNSLH